MEKVVGQRWADGNGVRLSVIMPVFNERFTLRDIVERVLAQDGKPGIASLQLVIVDDGSTDGSREIIGELAGADTRVVALFQQGNRGKTAAITTGIAEANGDVIVFQDADLEYDPTEFQRLLKPILAGTADVVYGSRFMPHEYCRVLSFWHSLMNRFLTGFSNFFTDLSLSDMETCYKMFRATLLKSIPLRSSGFGLEPEITAKVAKRRFRVYEVPISYQGRTYEEGKKITWVDGIKALYYILKYWVIDDCYRDDLVGHEALQTMGLAPRFNKWMADVIRPFVGNRVLEIGAGIGNLTSQLVPRDRLFTTDIDPLHVEALTSRFAGNPRVEVRRLDAARPEDYAALGERVDSVVCLNILEHVEDDLQVLRNIRSVLIPGGKVIILVPQGQGLFGAIDRAVGHRRRYSREAVEEKLKSAGFEIQRVFSFNRPGVPGWLLNGRIFGKSTISRVQLKIFDHLVFLFRMIDASLPWPSLSLIAIGRKPA